MKLYKPGGQFWWLAGHWSPSFLPPFFELVVLLSWVCSGLDRRTSWRTLQSCLRRKEMGLMRAVLLLWSLPACSHFFAVLVFVLLS